MANLLFDATVRSVAVFRLHVLSNLLLRWCGKKTQPASTRTITSSQRQSTSRSVPGSGGWQRRFPNSQNRAVACWTWGCGEGSLCAELKAAGWKRVFGIDVSGRTNCPARQLHAGIAFEDGPLGRSSFGGEQLELAIMDNIIEHLPDPAKVLSEVHARLLQGGRIVVITPNMACGHFGCWGAAGRLSFHPDAHIFLFVRSSLSLLLERTGFAIEAAGDFHTPGCGWRSWLGGLVSGDVKTAIWRGVQGAGALYSRVIHAGPMLYVVGSRE